MKLRLSLITSKTRTLKARLSILVGLLCLMLLVGAGLGLIFMAQENEGTQAIYERGLVPSQYVDTMRSNTLMYFVVLNEAATLVGKPDQLKQKLDEASKIQTEVDEALTKLRALPQSPTLAAAMKNYDATDKDYQQARSDVLGAIKQGDNQAGDLVEMEMRPLMVLRQDALAKIVEAQRKQASQLFQDQLRTYQHVRLLVIVALLAGLLFAGFRSVTLIRSISRALQHAMKLAHEIADGKLGHKVTLEGDDELARLLAALQSMDQRLVEIVSEVRKGSEAVSSAAQQIASGNDDLSERTQGQASSLEETASSMEEMTSTVKQNAENASHADQLARGAREQAQRGGDVAAQAIDAMQEINASSRKIADIVSLIDEIAFQTNLLALNAAVEAARAGEQGRGFAVVATEVRSLAQRSASAAKEIKQLINESSDRVRAGSALVDQSGKALAEIVNSIKKVTDIVAEIAAASSEQSAGIDQVNLAVSQMDEMTQQNAALVEEASAAAHAMREQAEELAAQVSFFQIPEFSGQATTGAPSKRPRVSSAAAEAESVFAAVRQSAPPRTAGHAEQTDANVWKEF